MMVLATVVVVVASVALVGAGVGLGIPFWASMSSTKTVTRDVTTTTYTGLWNTCQRETIETSTVIGCVTLVGDDATDALRAVQACSIIGTAGCGLVVVLAFIKICVLKDNSVICKVIAVSAITAGVFLLLAPIIYGTKVKSDNHIDVTDLHAGFAMTIISGCLIILVGILAFFVK